MGIGWVLSISQEVKCGAILVSKVPTLIVGTFIQLGLSLPADSTCLCQWWKRPKVAATIRHSCAISVWCPSRDPVFSI